MKNIKTDNIYEFDQFYTKENVALKCFNKLSSIYKLDDFDCIIEPSAGTGSFYRLLPTSNRIAIEIDNDLCSANKDYLNISFFDYIPSINKSIIVIGNPPFGTQNKLAVDFFNHAAKFAKVIAFIVPRTWKKTSIQNRLDFNFKLISSTNLPEDCFVGSKLTMVKCCFQIWEKSVISRTKKKQLISHKDWEFLPYIKKDNELYPPTEADFIILAYGCNPGQISTDLYRWRPKSVHFIKANISKDLLIKRFEELNYSVADNSARQSSLCKADLVNLYSKKYK